MDTQQKSILHTEIVQGLLAERDIEIINLRIRVRELQIALTQATATAPVVEANDAVGPLPS